MSEFSCGSCGEILRSRDVRCPECGSGYLLMDGMTGREHDLRDRDGGREEELDDETE